MTTGLEIAMVKRSETDAAVEYSFFVRDGSGGMIVPRPTEQPGRVLLNKATGVVELLQPCPDDDDASVLFSRATAALRRQWRLREYPARTSWAG